MIKRGVRLGTDATCPGVVLWWDRSYTFHEAARNYPDMCRQVVMAR